MATLLGGTHMRRSLRSLALCGAASLILAACAHTVGEAPNPAMLVASPTSPSNLKIESASTLLGADVLRPRFQWLAPQATRTHQTHYRLQVATSEAGLLAGDLVWDSGEVASSDQAQVAYGGPALVSRGRYVWRVQTRDAAGRTSDWSSPAVWEMGLLQPGDWQARWISADAAAEHIWSDAATEWRFTPTGGDIDLLFRASPVGKTFGDAYAWRLGISEGQPTLTAISRTYDAKAQPLVKETTLKTVALPLTQAQWVGGPHTLTGSGTLYDVRDRPAISWTDLTPLTLAGTAVRVNDFIRLTHNGGNQAGAAWANTQIDPRGDLHTSFVVSMHDGGGNPADGIAFVLVDPAQPLLGGAGGGIGYAGLAPSLALEFDIYQNGGEPNANQVEVLRNGARLATVDPGFALHGSGPVYAWVDYSAGTLTVFVSQTATKPALPLLTTSVDLRALLGKQARVGFTAATGGSVAQQDLLSWTLSNETLPG